MKLKEIKNRCKFNVFKPGEGPQSRIQTVYANYGHEKKLLSVFMYTTNSVIYNSEVRG